jgi:hypothetical protein
MRKKRDVWVVASGYETPEAHPVPLYAPALTSPSIELGGELADGIMPILWPAARVKQSKAPVIDPSRHVLALAEEELQPCP